MSKLAAMLSADLMEAEGRGYEAGFAARGIAMQSEVLTARMQGQQEAMSHAAREEGLLLREDVAVIHERLMTFRFMLAQGDTRRTILNEIVADFAKLLDGKPVIE